MGSPFLSWYELMGTTCEFSGPDQASHEVDTSRDTFVWKPFTLMLIQEWVLVQDILQFKTERLVKIIFYNMLRGPTPD